MCEVQLYLVQVTKGQVAGMLDSRGAELANNVEALLLAVKSTNDFEAEMARRFGGSTSEDTEHEVHAMMTCNVTMTTVCCKVSASHGSNVRSVLAGVEKHCMLHLVR